MIYNIIDAMISVSRPVPGESIDKKREKIKTATLSLSLSFIDRYFHRALSLDLGFLCATYLAGGELKTGKILPLFL